MTRWRRTRRWCGRHRRRFVAAAAAVLVAAGLIATGMAMKPHTRTAEEEFAAIERELDAGQEVVLVGPTSLPRWHRWAVSEGAIAPSAARDGTYDLQSHGLAFLELLPDPRCERYRFRGELRHVGGNQGGVTAVGLYVGFENVVAANTGHSVHPVLLAWYEDVFSGTDQIKIAKKQPVQHIARLEFATPFCAFNHYPYMRHHSSNDERGLTFIPQERPPVPWRTIELHVSPEGVEMFWATDGGPLVRAHRVSASDLALDRRDIREDVQARELGTLLGDRSVAIPEWNPRRSLGIWVQRSTVSFRNVSIVPLP